MEIEPTGNNTCLIFFLNKDVPSFYFDSWKQKFNHLKVKEVVGTIQGVPGLRASHMCEFPADRID